MRQEDGETNNPIENLRGLINLQGEHANFLERGLNPIFPAGALDFYEDLRTKILIKQIQLLLTKFEYELNRLEKSIYEDPKQKTLERGAKNWETTMIGLELPKELVLIPTRVC